MKPHVIEFTAYQKAYLWLKANYASLTSTIIDKERNILVTNRSGIGVGKTIAEAIENYIANQA